MKASRKYLEFMRTILQGGHTDRKAAPLADVAHALMRAASALVPTHGRCRDESRHGTQECVRYIKRPQSNSSGGGFATNPLYSNKSYTILSVTAMKNGKLI